MGDTPAAPTAVGPPVTNGSSSKDPQQGSLPPSDGPSSNGPTPPLLVGHLGHLTQSQEQAFASFKKELASKGIYNESSPSIDDGNLLRFLRARKFDLKGAIDQFSTTEAWRKEVKLDQLYEGYDITAFEEAKKVNPIWIGRRNKAGQPVYVFRVSDLDKKAMSRYLDSSEAAKHSASDTTMPNPVVPLYEHLTRFVLPLCSKLTDRPHLETPLVSSCNIIDINNVSIMQFYSLKNHLADASALATARYPETLASIYVVGAPSYIELVFTFIKTWFDPVTRAKIHVLPADKSKAFKVLSENIHPDSIPKAYGGNLEWDFGDRPSIDPAITEACGMKECPTGSVAIVGDEIQALGQMDGNQRREVVGKI